MWQIEHGGSSLETICKLHSRDRAWLLVTALGPAAMSGTCFPNRYCRKSCFSLSDSQLLIFFSSWPTKKEKSPQPRGKKTTNFPQEGGVCVWGVNNDNHHHFIHYHCHFEKLTDLSNCILQNLTKSLPTQSSNTHTIFSAFQVPGSLQHKGSYFTPEKVYQVFHSWVKAEAAISGRPDRSQPAACLSAQWPAIAEGTETSGEHRGNISSP